MPPALQHGLGAAGVGYQVAALHASGTAAYFVLTIRCILPVVSSTPLAGRGAMQWCECVSKQLAQCLHIYTFTAFDGYKV